MKKLLPLFAVLSAMLLASCGGTKTEPSKPSIQLGETTLTFAASGNPSQTVTVTANVAWSVSVASTASDWLHATKTDDGTITVTVVDNSAEQRMGVVTVSADAGGVTPKNITVTQAEATVPDVSLSVEPAAMTFEGDKAEPQTATVTVSDEQLEWSAAPEEAIADWVTVTASGDKLTVAVSDNPETTERSGNVIITPSIKTASPKAIRVIQEGRILPPSIEVSEKELSFGSSRETIAKTVTVTAVNTDWDAVILKQEDVDVSWLELKVTKTEQASSFSVNVQNNPIDRERTGYIVVKATDPALEEIRVRVVQGAGVPYLSNLTEDVELTDISQGISNDVFFQPNQLWHDKDFATWQMELWADGVTRHKDWYGMWFYSGAGTRLFLKFRTERIEHNDDETYELPSGDYVVSNAEQIVPWTLDCGLATNNFSTPNGCWYMEVAGEDNTFGKLAPLTEGKITVSRTGEDYTLVLDLRDDAGFAITGTCVTKLDNIEIGYYPLPDPSTKPEKPSEPDPEVPTDPNEPTPY